MSDDAVKSCTRCHTVNPIDAYYHNKNRADGHHAICKRCHQERYEETRKWSPDPIPNPRTLPPVTLLPRRRYDTCPHCGGHWLGTDTDGDCACNTCGWSQPTHKLLEAAV